MLLCDYDRQIEGMVTRDRLGSRQTDRRADRLVSRKTERRADRLEGRQQKKEQTCRKKTKKDVQISKKDKQADVQTFWDADRQTCRHNKKQTYEQTCW